MQNITFIYKLSHTIYDLIFFVPIENNTLNNLSRTKVVYKNWKYQRFFLKYIYSLSVLFLQTSFSLIPCSNSICYVQLSSWNEIHCYILGIPICYAMLWKIWWYSNMKIQFYFVVVNNKYLSLAFIVCFFYSFVVYNNHQAFTIAWCDYSTLKTL